MIPWEREVYVGLLTEYIEKENLKRQQREGVEGNGRRTHGRRTGSKKS